MYDMPMVSRQGMALAGEHRQRRAHTVYAVQGDGQGDSAVGSGVGDRGHFGGLGGGNWAPLVDHYTLKCAQCESALPTPKRPGMLGEGRPREYCSGKCVSRAFRLRRKALQQWLTEMDS